VAPESAQVKERARALGFTLCGIAEARALDRGPFDAWLANGWHAGLAYMTERLEERTDPRVLLPGARSVIVLAASYGAQALTPVPAPGELVVARYARGRDYHNVLLKRARKLAAWLRLSGEGVYCAVDTGAIAEKAWAQAAGLGWLGKNGLLIHPDYGSWLLLGALVTTLALEPDAPHRDRCGDCRACLPACPTGAIREGRLVDSRACLAFHTIEHRGPIPPTLAARAEARVFGCDACQDACPWNRRTRPGTLVQLQAVRAQTSLPLEELLALTQAQARARYEGTPLLRADRDGLVRSALALAVRPLTARVRSLASGLVDDPAEGVRTEARRALADVAG
jgi:epoxyqueuosine reductase